MTIQGDNTDWTGAQATGGNARLVATGNYTPGTSPAIPIQLQATDRSLVFILAPGAYVGARPVVTGTSSGLNWAQNIGNGNAAGGFFGPTDCPIVIPCYGVIDPTVMVTFTEEVAGNPIPYWIMASSDAVNPAKNLSAQVIDGDNAGEQSNSTVLTNSALQLVAAPLSGKVNVIDTITFMDNSVASDVQLIAGSASGPWLAAFGLPASSTTDQVLLPRWHMTQSLWVAQSATAGVRVTAAWHTVSTPS